MWKETCLEVESCIRFQKQHGINVFHLSLIPHADIIPQTKDKTWGFHISVVKFREQIICAWLPFILLLAYRTDIEIA